MGIPRNGFRISKSLSPLTMQFAFPLIASDRNLSSRGFDLGRRTALKIAFVSKTNLFGIEHSLQFVFR